MSFITLDNTGVNSDFTIALNLLLAENLKWLVKKTNKSCQENILPSLARENRVKKSSLINWVMSFRLPLDLFYRAAVLEIKKKILRIGP